LNIDADPGRAIVKAVNAAGRTELQSSPELVPVAEGLSVIVIGPTPALRRISWLQLIEIAPARFLLTIPSGTPIDSLELSVIDLLERSEALQPDEAAILQQLRRLIGNLRRDSEVSKAELLLVQNRLAT